MRLEMSEVNALPSYLVFGSTGVLGSAVAEKLAAEGLVIKAPRELDRLDKACDQISYFNGVIWAQGLNGESDAFTYQEEILDQMLQANLKYVLKSLKMLLEKELISSGSNLLVVSSIWGNKARPNKLNYSISKAALAAAVRSFAVDLGPIGISINAIAPGPVDSRMTRKMLSKKLVDRVVSETPLKRLVNPSEVAEVALSLLAGRMPGVTGQEIAIDGGWGISKLV